MTYTLKLASLSNAILLPNSTNVIKLAAINLSLAEDLGYFSVELNAAPDDCETSQSIFCQQTRMRIGAARLPPLPTQCCGDKFGHARLNLKIPAVG